MSEAIDGKYLFLSPKQYNEIHSKTTGLIIVEKMASEEIKELESKLSVAVKALGFYASTENWYWTRVNLRYDQIGQDDCSNLPHHSLEDIGGKTAREALDKINQDIEKDSIREMK